ncbi:hypothetical protein BK142_22855 [Paenibacillus glucanolyticus]|nr:hypothetical protein BK142_22855 [Paenibacillus glucanolyticus]
MLHRTQRYGRAGRAVSDRTVSGGIGLYPTSDPLLLLFARSWVIYRTHDRIGPGCIEPQIRYYCFLLAIGGSIRHTIGSGRAVSNNEGLIR